MSSGILYQRGDEEGDSDVWDDTLLIKAYDNAVSAMKAKLAAQHPEYAASNDSGSKKKKKNKQKAKKKNASKQKNNNHSRSWSVGDFCQAVFTEDGEIYSAQIISVDHDTESCVVKYVGYGNEEEQLLDSLLPPLSEPSSQDNKTDTASEVESSHEMPKERPSVRRKANRGTFVGGRSSKSNVPPWSWNQFAIPHPPPPLSPQTPAAHYPSFPHPPSFPPAGYGPSSHIPPMFPGIPPPPPLFNSQDGTDKEALYSMLISWYMSGYHTGYYQGLKSAKASHYNGPLR